MSGRVCSYDSKDKPLRQISYKRKEKCRWKRTYQQEYLSQLSTDFETLNAEFSYRDKSNAAFVLHAAFITMYDFSNFSPFLFPVESDIGLQDGVFVDVLKCMPDIRS